MQETNTNKNTAIFQSPVISRQHKYLKLSYRLTNGGVLAIKLVYSREVTKKFEHSVLLKRFEVEEPSGRMDSSER